MTTGDAEPPPPGGARRFIAVPVPPSVRAGVVSALPPRDAAAAWDLRWTRPEGWHVTLAFLGKVTDDRVTAVTEAVGAGVARAAQRPERLRIGEAGRFGGKVLWVGVDDTPAGSLAALADAVRDAIEPLGFALDRRPLSPHLTLARGGRRPVSAAAVAACRVPPGLAWQPTAIELWRSQLGDGPARYVTEATIPLEAGHT